MAFTLPEQMVRTVGIFQGLLALPVLLFTAAVALQALAYAYDYVYEFTASMFLCLFASGIIFGVWIQRSVRMSRKVTLYFELAKSGFATAIWLWLILDAAFGPGIHRYRGNGPRKPMVLRAAISVIVLFILYYPTLAWAIFDQKLHGEAVAAPERDEEVDGEREPLLT
ncbi:hypothetical protein V8E51_004694 [Hyaloscypha variabilis]